MAALRRSAAVLLVVGLLVLAGCAGSVPGDSASGESLTADGDSLTSASPSPTATTAETANGTLEVHYINVGQSVSTLIIGPNGETMLVDTGHYNDDGEYVLAYLQRHDIDRIDHLVSSHGDADHIGGNAAVIEYFETEANGIGAIYDPGIAASTQTYGAYLDAVEEHDVTLYETREGDTIPFGAVEVDVLGPPDPYLANGDRNENSIVLKLTHGETSFLLTGDAEDDQEAYLVEEYGASLQTTVLKAGHHGSSSSTSETFLEAAQPQAVVISSAYDSQYGHPHEEVLQRLSDRSIPAYWTATHGTTVLTSDGDRVTISTQRSAPTAATALRDGDAVAPGTDGDVTERTRINGDSVTEIATPDDTPTETATESSDGPTGDSTLTVAEVHADADGHDRENLNDEYVVFENAGEEPLDLSGWTVTDEADHSYTIPEGFTLGAGESVTLHTGSGTDSETDLYWDSGSPIWNNDGDTVIVTDADGERVLEVSYS